MKAHVSNDDCTGYIIEMKINIKNHNYENLSVFNNKMSVKSRLEMTCLYQTVDFLHFQKYLTSSALRFTRKTCP